MVIYSRTLQEKATRNNCSICLKTIPEFAKTGWRKLRKQDDKDLNQVPPEYKSQRLFLTQPAWSKDLSEMSKLDSVYETSGNDVWTFLLICQKATLKCYTNSSLLAARSTKQTSWRVDNGLLGRRTGGPSAPHGVIPKQILPRK
jgi:hypothetical protein